MATNLAKNFNVIACDTNEMAQELAQEAGMQVVENVEQVGSMGCEVVLTMLPGCDAVNRVTPLLLGACSAPTVFVDCSTVC